MLCKTCLLVIYKVLLFLINFQEYQKTQQHLVLRDEFRSDNEDSSFVKMIQSGTSQAQIILV